MAEYEPGRGYGGGQGRRGPRIDENMTVGEFIKQRGGKSGYNTQSLWQGRSNFMQTSGNEDRSIMPSTVVPRGTGRTPFGNALSRVVKDKAKMMLGVPDISLSDWGGEGPKGYKFRDVVGAAKAARAGTPSGRFDYSNIVSNEWKAPTKGSAGWNTPSGPAVGGGGNAPLPPPTAQPVRVGNMNWFPNGGGPNAQQAAQVASMVIGGAARVAGNATVQGAVKGAVKGAIIGGPAGAVVGAVKGGARAANPPPIKTASGKPVDPVTVDDSWRPPF